MSEKSSARYDYNYAARQRAYEVSRREALVKAGELIPLGDSGAYLTPDEMETFLNDLDKDGLQMLLPGDDQSRSSCLYLDDKHFVLVRKVEPSASRATCPAAQARQPVTP